MTIFEAVKSTVTPRMAAEHFGLSVSRNGMACCPFHNDRHPSMKLNEDYFYCFGCGAKGDVIEFTSKLFGITAMEAVQKLRADFGVQEDKPSILTKLNLYRTQADNERLCFRVLREYLQILQDWKVRFSPQTLEDDPDDRFVEACHMDEKTPHMHLCFVPLTEDKRLSAKEIVGNKKKLTWWQDEFWKHMVKKYPDLERGESASETGRTHIPPRLFKEAVHLNRMKEQILQILNDTTLFNKKAKAEELDALLGRYVPSVEAMRAKLKKYDKLYTELTEENAALEKKLDSSSRESIQKKLEIQRKLSELDELRRTVDAIPDEVIRAYTAQKYVHNGRMNQEI